MTTAPRPTPPDHPPVLVIMGVSGVGKSTVAALLAETLGWDFAEGDVMHPTANVEKMAAGQPLDDDDRWPWLEIVASWIRTHSDAGQPGIITCSALKRAYRDVLRGPDVVFVHLAGPTELIGERITARIDHFMPPTLLASQVATLEPLGDDERHIVVDAGFAPEVEVGLIVDALGLAEGVD
jgi:gluconokinase